jgi:hypothetical protein
MKKWLVLFIFAFLATSCAVQKINFSWSDYRMVLSKYIDNPDSVNQRNLNNCLLRVISESVKQKKTIPPGIYLEYAFLLETEGYHDMARQYYDLEKKLYPSSSLLIDDLLSKPK